MSRDTESYRSERMALQHEMDEIERELGKTHKDKERLLVKSERLTVELKGAKENFEEEMSKAKITINHLEKEKKLILRERDALQNQINRLSKLLATKGYWEHKDYTEAERMVEQAQDQLDQLKQEKLDLIEQKNGIVREIEEQKRAKDLVDSQLIVKSLVNEIKTELSESLDAIPVNEIPEDKGDIDLVKARYQIGKLRVANEALKIKLFN